MISYSSNMSIVYFALTDLSFPEIIPHVMFPFLGFGSVPSQSMVDILDWVASLEGVRLSARYDG